MIVAIGNKDIEIPKSSLIGIGMVRNIFLRMSPVSASTKEPAKTEKTPPIKALINH